MIYSVPLCTSWWLLFLSSFFLAFKTERTYFQVYLPKESRESSQPMFFCSKWSVGKVVDYAASLASLKNNNNILTAKVTDTHLCTYNYHLMTNLLLHASTIFSAVHSYNHCFHLKGHLNSS